jgi:VanZ family protein
MSQYIQPLFKCLAIALLIAIVVLSVVPAELRPDTDVPHDIEHGAIFALFGVALVLGYRLRFLTWVMLGPLFAAAIELAQLYIPGRHSRLSDFLVDAAGVLLGSVCAVLVLKIHRTWVAHERWEGPAI